MPTSSQVVAALLSVSLAGMMPDALAAWQLEIRGQRYVANQAQDPANLVQVVQTQDKLWLDAAGRYLLVTDSRWPGGIRFSFRQFGGGQGGAVVDLLRWREGNWISRKNPQQAHQDFTDQSYLLPALLQQQLQVSAGQWQDRAGRLVGISTNPAGQLTVAQHQAARYEYFDYPDTGKDAQPARIKLYRNGQLSAEFSTSRREVAMPADWDQLASVYQDKPKPVALTATQLAAGVYRIDGSPSGYHSSFVVGRDAVAVFDTPVSPDENSAIRQLIRQTSGNKPIRYIVLSHHHRDHIAGLPAYAADKPQVLVGAGGQAALVRQLGAEWQLLSREIGSNTTLDLGLRQLQLWPLASSHARDMLVGFDGQSGTVFQGDLFYLPEAGPVPAAFAVGRELADLLKLQLGEQPAVQRLVGVHGRTGNWQEFQQSLQLATGNTL